MKKYLLFFFLSCTALIYAQEKSSYHVEILPGSELTITGDTNISDFLCDYNLDKLERNYRVNFFLNPDGVEFRETLLQLKNEGFDCGSRAINKDFHALLRTDDYPVIDFELTEIQVQNKQLVLAKVEITIAGKLKEYQIPIKLFPSIKEGVATQQRLEGHLKLSISDYNLEPPKKLFGLIVVKDDIQINFDLIVRKKPLSLPS